MFRIELQVSRTVLLYSKCTAEPKRTTFQFPTKTTTTTCNPSSGRTFLFLFHCLETSKSVPQQKAKRSIFQSCSASRPPNYHAEGIAHLSCESVQHNKSAVSESLGIRKKAFRADSSLSPDLTHPKCNHFELLHPKPHFTTEYDKDPEVSTVHFSSNW